MIYTHLTNEERDKLAVLRSRGWKLREIAEKIGRSMGTLSRELKRNNSHALIFRIKPRSGRKGARPKNTSVNG